MPKRGQKTQRDFAHTWYAREWLEHYGKRQSDLIRDLGWPKAKASDVWNGQPYRQELVDELAPYLNLDPFELLMTPALAMSFRGLKSSAKLIVTEAEPASTTKPRTGTDG